MLHKLTLPWVGQIISKFRTPPSPCLQAREEGWGSSLSSPPFMPLSPPLPGKGISVPQIGLCEPRVISGLMGP
eukprot:1541863-Pyramimonas_sp.AAC.1